MYDGQLELFPILDPPGLHTRRLKPAEFRVLDKIAQLSVETGWTRALDDLTAHYLRMSVRSLQRHRAFLRDCGLIETEYYANKRLRARLTIAGREVLARDRFILDPPARRGRSVAPAAAVVSEAPTPVVTQAPAARRAPAARFAFAVATGKGGAAAPPLATIGGSVPPIVVSDPPDVGSLPPIGGSLVLDCVQDSVLDCVQERAPARERRRLAYQTRQLSERNRRRRNPAPRSSLTSREPAVAFAVAPSAPPAPAPVVPPTPPPTEPAEPLRPEPAPVRGAEVPTVWREALERMHSRIPPVFVMHLIARLECRETPTGLQLIAPDEDLFGRIRRFYWDEILRALAQPAELALAGETSGPDEPAAHCVRIECAEWRAALVQLRRKVAWPFFEDLFGRVEFQRLSSTEIRLIAPDVHRARRIGHGYLDEVREALGGEVVIHVEARAA